MAARRVQGSSFGQRRPPLTDILKSILERYPDGGQILKEIIQNADDAGARKISFLLDTRQDHYGKSSLYHPDYLREPSPGLRNFQGPALYAQNDALFKEDDWENLMNLMKSNKKDDPLKVGRFGIGFNSVYHITDLPGLVSGGRLGFLDPHETHFVRNESGQQFSLEDPLLDDFCDQFSPFEDVLDCKISTGYYEGTLFRFPLRNEPSQLSSKPYTVEKVKNLFESLRQEAKLILLFLKNVEEICLYETNEVSKEILVFSVKLKDTCRTQVREERRKFLEKLTPLDPTNGKIELCQKVAIEETEQQRTICHDWLIYNCVDPTNSRIRELYEQLGLLPWVGFATPLTRAAGPSEGRIFCFLPLPPDADAKTGFPVHIHGYFGLSDNRRGLKWPGPDCQNDDTAEWNELLLKIVGSNAYAALLEALTKTSNESKDLAYQSWPFIENVQAHWKCIIEPMIKILVQKNVFWTEADGGKWIKAQECLLNRMEVATPPVLSHLIHTVLQTLTQASESVVTVPSHMMLIISTLMSTWVQIREVTPACVRALLKKKHQGHWTLANMRRDEKLKLLEYILLDNQFFDLEGIALLPKADGTFVDFRSLRHNTEASANVYVTSLEHPRELFPNFDQQLLDQRIPARVSQCLSQLANNPHHPFQLVTLDTPLAKKLLWNVIPKEWLQGNKYLEWFPERNHHPSQSWLKVLWEWLGPRSLTSFEGYPLIPHTNGGKHFIEKLSKPTTVIKKQWHPSKMPDVVAAVLRKCQCVVLDSLPEYVTHRSLQAYIAFPNAEGVLSVLQSLERGGCIQRIAQCSPDQKRTLRQYLTGIATVNQGQTDLLLQLPIFEGIDGKSFLALNSRKGVAPPRSQLPEGLSIREASHVISADDDSSCHLLKLLGVSLPKVPDFLVSRVFPVISSGFYSHKEVTSLMLWVLKNFNTFQFQFPMFGSHLKMLRCIPLENDSLVMSSESFDPRDTLLQELFKGDNAKFPRVDFCDQTLLLVLSSLGMQCIPKPDDLLNVARCLPSVAYDVARQRGMALLKILSKHTEMLKAKVPSTGKSLAEGLIDLPWIPCQQTPPESYPRVMPWQTGYGTLYKPSDSKHFKHANLVGASKPIAPRTESAAVEKAFGWDKDPPLPSVLQQLTIACTKVHEQSMNGRQMEYFRNMLREIYQVLSEAKDQLWQLCSPDIPGWIWHGSGFAPPSRMAFHSDCQLNLKPHLYTVPDDFQEFHDLFVKFGVRETFRESDLLSVLHMIKESHEKGNVSGDLQLCIDILHWIVKDHQPVSENLCQSVLVPAMTYDNTLKLVPCGEANYCDADWLRGGGSELQITSDYTLIHERISITTASLLRVPPISTSLTSAEPLGFEQTGPHEPITTRLKNILDEYKEGAGVLKELVQNADDAGATEVKLLVDWRNHDTHKLLSPGMADCQGPALLAYSNSVFTDDDLQNISKLAGATKKEDMEKIGRFGLGFSSVYHFTDVPSFLTREYAVFFDPHTKHLGAHIKNSSRPGIKLNLKLNSKPLKAFPDQFKPYNGIFGCNTSGNNGSFYFDGTLFRFPFRKKAGEISDKKYSREDMRKLLISFQAISSNLLLFVQNVKQVSIFEIEESARDPSSPRMLLNVSREEKPAFPGKTNPPKKSFLKDCAEWNRSATREHMSAGKAPKRSNIVSVKRTIYQADGDVDHQECSKWLISSCLGQKKSFEVATSQEGRAQGLLSCASVAARLNPSGSGASTAATRGEAFCFLPLSISTGLPAHVNGYFAVTSNRRGIWEATTTEIGHTGKPLEARWNEVLMEDALAEAYLNLLVDLAQLKQLQKIQLYGFSSLWPNIKAMHSHAWKPLIKSVYSQIATTPCPLVECGPQWLSVKQCVFPDKDLHKLPGSFEILRTFGYKIAELPLFAYEGFREAGCGAIIEDHKMTKETFLIKVFFPKIAEISARLRNPIVCYILDEHLRPSNNKKMTRYHDLLCNSPCIPCTEDQRNLARPKDLVDPTGKAAPFFSAADRRFPVGDCYCTAQRLLALQKLGMVKDHLDWTAICERAKSVESLKQQDMRCALQRVKYLIKYLNDTTLGPAPSDVRGRICKTEILPVLGKPHDCTLPWKGTGHHSRFLLSAEELYDEKHKYLVGASKAIVDESEGQGCGQMSSETKAFFGFPTKCPKVDDILLQLKYCADVVLTSLNSSSITYLKNSLSRIYEELSSLKGVPAPLQQESYSPWVWHGAGFAHPSRMAFSSVGKLDLKPYFFVVPKEFVQYRRLFLAAGIKDQFEESDLLDVLGLIKQCHETTTSSSEDSIHDLKLVTDILHWLIRKGRPVEEQLQHKVLVPVTTRDRTLKLVPYDEATYCDAAWLRKGGSELSITSDLALIHDQLSNNTARLLRVPPISTCLASAETFGFEQTGPYEPITTRLRNILDEYKEGAGVLKELVQNADDAGATKVKILVDWRNHASEKLLAKGMAQCQGPALLAYSDSVFTDDDMRNINKVAGATKKEDTEKIGRFGLGFSSVYHFTDVPSFLTRNYAVFFDPCLSHLGHHIQDKLRPGIKLDLEANPRPLEAFPDQFLPYNEIFGCHTNAPDGSLPFHFKGTLFRFPLRKKPGEISSKIYKKADVEELLLSFKSILSTLLLFVQNVDEVSVLELDQGTKTPSTPTILFTVSKQMLPGLLPPASSCFLRDCAKWTKQAQNKELLSEATTPSPRQSDLLSITSKGYERNGSVRSEESATWFVRSCLGEKGSLKMATSEEGRHHGLLSCAGVATMVKLSNQNTKEPFHEINRIEGEAFSFLPLSIPTGLPVHVNGHFAVTSNRRGIWEATTAEHWTDSVPLEARWNETLMDDALAGAYLVLLQDMVTLEKKRILQSYHFSSLWPNPEKLKSTTWMPLLKSVYHQIALSSFPFVCSGSDWFPVNDCIYPDAGLQAVPGSIEILCALGYKMVDLPPFANQGFREAGCSSIIEDRRMTQDKFLQDVFFPTISEISVQLRDPVICYVLDECFRSETPKQQEKQAFFKSLLENHRCIPCSTTDLAYPKDLVDPYGAASVLFESEDNCFPLGKCYRTKERLLMLANIGMAKDLLSWDLLSERAKSVSRLTERTAAKERAVKLVRYLDDHLGALEPTPPDFKSELHTLKLFPVLAKPTDYTLSWRGEDYDDLTLLPASDVYEAKHKLLAGSLKPILDSSWESGCGTLGYSVQQLFGFSVCCPTVEETLQQLEDAIGCAQEQMSTSMSKCISAVSKDVYRYLQDHLCREEGPSIIEHLSSIPWILVGNKFCFSSQLAFEFKHNGSPYLFEVPTSFETRFSSILQAAGVRKKFEPEDFIEVLYKMQGDKDETALTEDELKVARCFLENLTNEEITKKQNGRIPVPDHNGVLRPANSLAINDVPWMRVINKVKYVNDAVPKALAYQLGSRDIRTVNLDDVSRPIGVSFGQHEKLTDRLKGILKNYPCDLGILKELVQNADDARATEIHFIFDPRTHSKERVLSDNWQELQGPALCVFNDQPFSEKDLEGIQRLGIGSKADDPAKTGQYGIGFNSVYHLTDCPSFISNGDTLCILDPHARYAPGATLEKPGRLIELDKETREDYEDVFPGYLEDEFDLSGGTMFRFPLRQDKTISQISDQVADIPQLMNTFRTEARDILLFLQHVKRISLSKIDDAGQRHSIYQVSAKLTEKDLQKRADLSAHVKHSKDLDTADIDWFGVTYPMTISDSLRDEEWLVHQCIGSNMLMPPTGLEVPNGKAKGLLPRAGVAAKIAESPKASQLTNLQTRNTHTFRAFCFLPLPITTGLPVHVNGHFHLDSGRRNLWRDDSDEGFGSKWNHFMKSHVLAEAYVSLIKEAREFIPGMLHQQGETGYFTKKYIMYEGMKWYNELFPPLGHVGTNWKELADAVYNKIVSGHEKVLPFVRKVKTTESAQGSSTQVCHPWKYPCEWLSPSEGFFNDFKATTDLQDLVLDVGFQLVGSPYGVLQDFKTVTKSVKQLCPENLLEFLKSDRTAIGELPCPVTETAIGSTKGVLLLLEYCMASPAFAQNLAGVPLLLTQDNCLKRFEVGTSVYLSRFYDLVPSKPHLFLHKSLAIPLLHHEKELFNDQNVSVVKKFDIAALAQFLPGIFPGQLSMSTKFVTWEKMNDAAFNTWLKRLWDFIYKVHKDAQDKNVLHPLLMWPVLPTTSSTLAPITLGKAVLDLTHNESWSHMQVEIVEILRKLKCPEADVNFMSTNGKWDIQPVLKTYVAHPNCSQDVLAVLDHLMQVRPIDGILTEEDMLKVLMFFQADIAALKQHAQCKSVIMKLPFFKSLSGKCVCLVGFSGSIYVVPEGLPLKECEVWMTGNHAIFLAPCLQLMVLYKELLGVDNRSQVECYLDFIFPKFGNLQPSTRLSLLEYLRDMIWPGTEAQKDKLQEALKSLAFIPNSSGTLHTASNFFDPNNEVFKVMLKKADFPTKPFNSGRWLWLLREIGLKKEVTKDQFLDFARKIESNVGNPESQLKKAEVLVSHLFEEDALHEPSFLRNLSTVKFIPPLSVNSTLTKFHPQYARSSRDELVAFRGAVDRKYEFLVWTSAPLLQFWAVPINSKLWEGLGVLKEPTIDQVTTHTKNLAQTLSRQTDREMLEPRRTMLQSVMVKIYTFLKAKSSCIQTDSLETCSNVCHRIGEHLQGVRCILVDNGRVFVKGDQLAFEIHSELPPYLYKVPREYGLFEHLLKRLGAVEEASPLQYAKMLHRLQENCKEEKMHAEEQSKAKSAVFGLFHTLNQAKEGSERRDSLKISAAHLSSLSVLYLPSQAQKLRKSTDLILDNCPEFTRSIKRVKDELLVELPRYDLTFARPEEIVSLLPACLRPKTLRSLVHEDLHPECQRSKCETHADGCVIVNRLLDVLFSQELACGIKRILKHERNSATLPEDVSAKVDNFQSTLTIACMKVLTTQLVYTERGQIIPESTRWPEVFSSIIPGNTCLYIKHGATGETVNTRICQEVNRLIDYCIIRESLLQLILSCRSPREISAKLDRTGVAKDVEAEEELPEEQELGSEIPVELHYLLVQFADFLFREGEMVGYEKEETDGNPEAEPKYIHARIIRRIHSTVTNSKPKKDRTKRKQRGESIYLSRYLIDIGSRKIEVDVLNLYKWKRPHEVDGPPPDESFPETRDIVPFEGASNTPPPSASAAPSPPKPTTFEEAKKEVRKAMNEIWKLPEDKRKKAIRRLYLRWHPDKNIGQEVLATEVMKFIQQEIDRLTRGGSSSASEDDFDFGSFFRQWDQRARTQRSSYQNFRQQNPGFSGFYHDSYRSRRSWGRHSADYTSPDSRMARLWMEQYQEDLRAVDHLLSSRQPFHYLVCSLCHEVVEKALKAALYSSSGISSTQLASHDLARLAVDVSGLPGAPNVVSLITTICDYYEPTRYPHKHHPAKVPAHVYTDQQAQEAWQITKRVVSRLEDFMGF